MQITANYDKLSIIPAYKYRLNQWRRQKKRFGPMYFVLFFTVYISHDHPAISNQKQMKLLYFFNITVLPDHRFDIIGSNMHLASVTVMSRVKNVTAKLHRPEQQSQWKTRQT